MKKQLIVLFLTLIPLIGYTQTITLNTISTESHQIDTAKVVALIFAEHEKLTIENPLLKQKIQLLDSLNKSYIQTDSLQRLEINTYIDLQNKKDKEIKQLKRKKKWWIGGSTIGIISSFLIGLFI